MAPSTGDELLERAKDWFLNEFVKAHRAQVAKLRSRADFSINPFLESYLAAYLDGAVTAQSKARALVLPRVLGTSVATIFGTRMQWFTTEVLQKVFGSTTQGIDIEFKDATTERRVMAQVKLGPNTINHDDVESIDRHFISARRLAKTNKAKDAKDAVLAVGVMYGEPSQLSAHYRRLRDERGYEVFVGADFWHRLTGQPDFYQKLVGVFAQLALDVDGRADIEGAVRRVAADYGSTQPWRQP